MPGLGAFSGRTRSCQGDDLSLIVSWNIYNPSLSNKEKTIMVPGPSLTPTCLAR